MLMSGVVALRTCKLQVVPYRCREAPQVQAAAPVGDGSAIVDILLTWPGGKVDFEVDGPSRFRSDASGACTILSTSMRQRNHILGQWGYTVVSVRLDNRPLGLLGLKSSGSPWQLACAPPASRCRHEAPFESDARRRHECHTARQVRSLPCRPPRRWRAPVVHPQHGQRQATARTLQRISYNNECPCLALYTCAFPTVIW
jgi:hypothetical protein